MKNGTVYAARMKKAYAKLHKSVPAPVIPERESALDSLCIAILGRTSGDARAERGVKKLLSIMVDWNEVRISNAQEICQTLGNIPNAQARAQHLIHALQAVYQNENRLSLDRLRHMGRRDARQYLENLAGVDEYAVASVLLWDLGGHAIPVDDVLLKALRDADLVHPTASRAEVQAFLERHIPANDAKEFCVIMRSFSANSAPVAKSVKTRTRKTAGTKKRKKATAK